MCAFTQPLYWQTQVLCILLENSWQSLMFTRGSPYNTSHITTVWAHTTIVRTDTSIVYTSKKNFQSIMFSRGSPCNTIHIITVWTQGTTVCNNNPTQNIVGSHTTILWTDTIIVWTDTTTAYTTGKQLSEPHV